MSGKIEIVERDGSADFDARFLDLGLRADPLLGKEAPPEKISALILRDGEASARASLYDVGEDAAVGRFEALDVESARRVLQWAVGRAKENGAHRLIGPLDGDTWHRYRLALQAEGAENQPWFAGEPRNPGFYVEAFEREGFEAISRYESRGMRPAPGMDQGKIPELRGRLRKKGYQVEWLQPGGWKGLLESVFELSLEAFKDNLYYRPIEKDEFLNLYLPLESKLDPEMVRWVKGKDGKVAAYALAYPDPLGPSLGAPKRVVLKTIASSPQLRGLGLGSLLTWDIAELALKKEYPLVIHALMQVSNASVKISRRQEAGVFRRYALYGKNW